MRTDNLTVAAIVRQFFDSKRADVWYMLGDTLRDALIDQAVIDHVRLADEDSDKPIKPSELIAFRDAVAAKLASHRTRPLRLESQLDESRERALRDSIREQVLNEARQRLGIKEPA